MCQKNVIYHHGILGQRWGVRRFQNKDGSLTDEGRIRYGNYSLNYTSVKNAERAKTLAKTLIVNALAYTIPGFGLAYNANLLYKSFDNKDYTKKEGEHEKISELKKKTKETTIEEDMKACNPRFGEKKGKINNCTYCAATMELRRRGYDVIARSKSTGELATIYTKWFDGATVESFSVHKGRGESNSSYHNRAYDEFLTNIEKQGDGARGVIGIQYEKVKSGHAMFYEVSNGTVTVYDGQNNKKDPKNVFVAADPERYSYCRLDNCKLNESVTEACRSNTK